jgi:hypothetical protein
VVQALDVVKLAQKLIGSNTGLLYGIEQFYKVIIGIGVLFGCYSSATSSIKGSLFTLPKD